MALPFVPRNGRDVGHHAEARFLMRFSPSLKSLLKGPDEKRPLRFQNPDSEIQAQGLREPLVIAHTT